jgi:hypothetical protein
MIINIYNDAPAKQNSILFRLRHLNIPNNPTILTGDFNLHHPLWSTDEFTTTEPITQAVVDWLSDKGFLLKNDKGMITHPARHSRERASVIDLSFVNGLAIAQDTFQEWAINTNIAGFSDHYGIQFTIDLGRKEIDNIYGCKFSLKKVKPEDWTKAFEKAILDLPQLTLTAEIDHPSTEDLDTFANLLTQTLQTATAATTQPCNSSTQAKPWWDNDLSSLAKSIAANCLLQKELNTLDL